MDLRSTRLAAAECFLEVVKRAGNFVGQHFALCAQDYVLVISPSEIATSAQALPQQHWGDMFDGGSASHTFL
jgi:hypothetical protein